MAHFIKKPKNAATKHFNDLNALIACSNTLDDENIDDYNPAENEKS